MTEKVEKRLKRDRSDFQTITVQLGRAEMPVYDQARRELGLNIRGLVRTALKFFIWAYKFTKEGGKLKMVHADGTEEPVVFLELEGAQTNAG